MLPIRTATPDDWQAIASLLSMLFHHTIDPEEDQLDQRQWEPDRSLVITEGDAVVAHATAVTRDLTVPGAVVPAAHVTMVGVAPTHRRRGALTGMMHQQLREVPEPIAVLWASEARIYGRFGYGLAGQRLELSVETSEVRLPAASAPPRLRVVLAAECRPDLAKVYDQLRADRTGWSSRSEATWGYVLSDTAARRNGATALRAVLHEGIGGIDGYALWRTQSSWTSGSNPDSEVLVREVAAANLEAYAALWRFLLSIDLTRTATYGFAAIDEPLVHLVNEPRRLNARFKDSLWVRLVDVGAALAARRYRTDIDVVIEVSDPLLPANNGRWRLTGGAERAACRRTDDSADLACDVRELGAAYLGGTSLTTLAAAGRVRELRPGALTAASTAFGWHRPPSAPEIYNPPMITASLTSL
ncbi:GNAT family N-acetyltransferase [Actinomycetes bacterium KLBMP 9797]